MKTWRIIMEEWEQMAKQFKSNAEFLESLCQDKLTHLHQDKRKARKTYQEEHNKIATQFTNVSSKRTEMRERKNSNTRHRIQLVCKCLLHMECT